MAVVIASYFYQLAGLLGLADEIFQIDFSTIYTAAKMAWLGHSLYLNPYLVAPDLWDQVAVYPYSRWLYPPLAAWLFTPLLLFPYQWAKIIWIVAIIGTLTASLSLTAKTLRVQFSLDHWLVLALVSVWFFPVWASLERGQIDAFCLVLLTGSFYLVAQGGKREFGAGLLVAFATLLKLHCGLILVFFLWQRKWRAAAGVCTGGLTLLLVSLIVTGWPANRDYVLVELPRISKYGCFGDQESVLPPIAARIKINKKASAKEIEDQKLYPSYVQYEGRTYVYAANKYSGTASPSLILKFIGSDRLTYGQYSQIMLVLALSLIFFLEKKRAPRSNLSPALDQTIFYFLGLATILICAPLTWTMNGVWLLPLCLIVLQYISNPAVSAQLPSRWMAVLVVGLFLVALPDQMSLYSRVEVTVFFLNFKPLLGHMLCFAALLGLRYASPPEPAAS
jgi:hypothetical protein